jgi:hypothetical protein
MWVFDIAFETFLKHFLFQLNSFADSKIWFLFVQLFVFCELRDFLLSLLGILWWLSVRKLFFAFHLFLIWWFLRVGAYFGRIKDFWLWFGDYFCVRADFLLDLFVFEFLLDENVFFWVSLQVFKCLSKKVTWTSPILVYFLGMIYEFLINVFFVAGYRINFFKSA